MNVPLVHIRTEDAVRHFKSKAALARALSVKPQAITLWREFLPPLRAFQLREMYPVIFVDKPARKSKKRNQPAKQ